MNQSAETAPVALRRRPDLIVQKRRFLGRDSYLVKEPIGLKYTRLQEEEFAILETLDGHTSQQEIKKFLEARFAPMKVSHMQLQQFFGTLHENGLVTSGMPGQGAELWRRANKKWWKEVAGRLANIFAIRWRGVDPDWLLGKLNRVTWVFFTWPVAILALLIGLSAVGLLAVNWTEFTRKLPDFQQFFGPGNWLYLGATVAVVKIIHEFGHGLACKRFGGECHQIGFMLLVFTPALYCDVSDAWLLDNKWKRMAISAAGIYFELFLAAVATLLWWTSYPGTLTHQLCLQVMFVASVSTLMFNANPLMRFDGYYILADYLEIPNLRQQSTQSLQRWMTEWCLGIEQPDDLFAPAKNRFSLALFTVASTIYRWVIVFSIAWFLSRILEPYGLKVIGQVIAMAGVVGMIAGPSWRLYKYLSTPGRLRDVRPAHAITTLLVLGSILGVLLIPFPHYVSCVCDVQPQHAVSIYVEEPGLLTAVSAKAGQTISVGDEIATLDNIELELAIEELLSKRHQIAERLQHLRRLRFAESRAGTELAEVESELIAIDDQIREQQRKQNKLTIAATASGVVLPAWRPPAKNNDILPAWSGHLLQPKNQNAPVRKGDVVCRIGDPELAEAILVIDQTSIDLAAVDQPVWVQLEADPGQLLHSTITEISPMNMTTASLSLSVQSGGGLATKPGSNGEVEPASASYTARAPLSLENQSIQVGLRGKAKIYVGNHSLLWRFYRSFIKTFRFAA